MSEDYARVYAEAVNPAKTQSRYSDDKHERARLATDTNTDSPPDVTDYELDAVESELYRLDPAGDRVAAVLRDTLDQQLYDGQHSGRWSYDHLHKTEKTHMGTLVEINLHRVFAFADGDITDYRIAGIEVDCKYSMTYGGWELPPEALGHICLLITANDATSTWTAGLLRVRESYLRGRSNRDAKNRSNRDAKKQLAAASRGRRQGGLMRRSVFKRGSPPTWHGYLGPVTRQR